MRIAVLENRYALDSIHKAGLFLHGRLMHGLKLIVATFVGTLVIVVPGLVAMAPVALVLAALVPVLRLGPVIVLGCLVLLPVMYVLAAMVGLRLPIESHPLQALVSEPIKPVLHTVVMSNAVHGYVSQSDKGDLVIGAGIDAYTGYGQRGSFPVIESTLAAMVELFPIFSRVRMNRQWGGIVDVSPDACPIIGLTPVKGLYFNCGWGTGGFKATPSSGWVFAHTIAHDRPHELNAAFTLARFATGRLIDEHGAAGVAH